MTGQNDEGEKPPNAETDAEELNSLHTEWDRSQTLTMRRGEDLMREIVRRCQIHTDTVFAAVVGYGADEKEAVAKQLRRELAELRRLEKIPGAQPAGWGKAMARARIADAAAMMVSSEIEHVPQLAHLIGELLNVDTYRRVRSEDPSYFFESAACLVAQYELDSVAYNKAEIAKLFGVNRSTVTRWFDDERFPKLVQDYKDMFTDDRLGPPRVPGRYIIMRE